MDRELVDIVIGAIAIVIIMGFVITIGGDRQEWLDKHCKVIHRNPDRTVMEYDAALKMVMPKTYYGRVFYECDDGKWHD